MTREEKIEKLKEIQRLLKILKKSIKLKNPDIREKITDKEITVMIDLIKSFNVIPNYQF
jgi:hypothetical protein